MWVDKRIPFESLVGKTLIKVEVSDDQYEINFETDTGEKFRMYHDQDCCENVRVEDITGDLQDLLNTPILVAEESSREAEAGECFESGTWTFYKLRTIKGSVDIRWLGESNGYYSESVDFAKV